MRMTRRRVIVLLGGGVVVAAAAPVAWLASRSVGPAVQPWSLAGGYSDPRKNALSWALLAPNPHNRQPWVAELVGDRGLHIYRDRAKNLPETDPFDRQLTIGMGCFLELMVMAAAQGGHAVELTLFPEGQSGPVAHAVLTPGGVPDPLFAHVLTRRTCKEPFEDRPLSAAHAKALEGYAEMNGPHQELHKMLRPDGGKVQMLARLGYGPIVPESPRWPLEAFLKGA